MKPRILFLCTGNSARSQMAEALLRLIAGDHFEAESAGTHPAGLNPTTVDTMQELGADVGHQRSKHVDELINQRFDYVITVCDRARATCPVFPGGSTTLHWGIDDPAEATGSDSERQAAFDKALKELSIRIHTFLPLVTSGRA